MAYLLLYGTGGWTSRWHIAPESELLIRTEVLRVGGEGSSELEVMDPASDTPALLVVAWPAVAAAVVIDTEGALSHVEGSGQYA